MEERQRYEEIANAEWRVLRRGRWGEVAGD